MSINKSYTIDVTCGNVRYDVPVLDFDEIDSTNDYAKHHADDLMSGMHIIRAAYQRKGRGQFDRTWLSPKGKNLLFSIVVHPPIMPSRMVPVTTITAEAVREVLAEISGLQFSIKKPNDVMCDGLKIAGILTEQTTVGQRLSAVVVGIGINVNAAAHELPSGASSLAMMTGCAYECDRCFRRVVARWCERYGEFITREGIHEDHLR